MEQTVTLGKVQVAMKELRDNGERISRRNVRRITGGSMSTVHRLMSQVEEVESFQDTSLDQPISDTLQKALYAEIKTQVRKVTDALHSQIQNLKSRENEALEALVKSEARVEKLEIDLNVLRSTLASERVEAGKSAAVAAEKIAAMSKQMEDKQGEIRALTDALNQAQIELAKAKIQVEHMEKLLALCKER